MRALLLFVSITVSFSQITASGSSDPAHSTPIAESTSSFNSTEYDSCGRELNDKLLLLENNHRETLVTGLDNPDNTNGWSYGFIRTPPELPVEVDVEMMILLLGGVDDDEQTMSTTAMLRMHWVDHRLQSPNPKCLNSSATYVINMAKNLPWYPQWQISNGRFSSVLRSESWEYSPVNVKCNGDVDWSMSFEFVVDCRLDVHYFPFDVQLCAIDLASPQYDLRVMKYNIETPAVTLHEAESRFSPLWEMAGYRTTIVSTSYPSVSFRFMLVRRPVFFISAIIVPTAAINTMTALLFVISANQEEKASSAVSCVVAYFFIDVLFFSLTPVSSDSLPTFAIFFTFHAYFAIFVCCVAARLIFYAEFVEENEAIDIMLQHDIAIDKTQRTKQDGIRKFRSPEFYNDLCLVLYIIVAVLSYICLFAYLPIGSGRIINNLLNAEKNPYSVPETEDE